MKESLTRWWSVLIMLLLGRTATVRGGNAGTCPPCPPGSQGGGAANETTCSWSGGMRDECYYTVRGKALTLQAAGNYYQLTCPSSVTVTLDDPSLPRLPTLRAAPTAVLQRCAPPRGPYSTALRALNVSVLDELELSRVSAGVALRSDHLTGLPRLQRLVLSGRERGEQLHAPSDMLAALTALEHLQLKHVALGDDGLMALPRSLQSLHLSSCGVSSVPVSALSRLPALTRLELNEPRLTQPPPLWAATALTAVTLGAPLHALPNLHALRVLVNVTIGGALDVRLPGGCGSLRRLYVFNAAVTSLPTDWLREGQCSELRELTVNFLHRLTAVHERALCGAVNLTALTVSGCPLLTTLHAALFGALRHLTTLNLSRNGLTALTDGMFSALTSLQQLDVSHNHLSSAALHAVTALPALTTLCVGHNPLGDLCAITADTTGKDTHTSQLHSTKLSPLSLLTSLQTLSLPATGVQRACVDWRRQLMRLRQLDLSSNNLTDLTLNDLTWERPKGVKVSVDLRKNPISHAVLSAVEYTRLRRDRRPTNGDGNVTATLRVDAAVTCDCSAYWMARAAADRLLPAALHGLTCRHQGVGVGVVMGMGVGVGGGGGGGKGGHVAELLEQVNVTTMVCEDVAQCSAGCSCKWRPHDDTLLVSCASLSHNTNNDTVSWPPLHAVRAARVELDLSRTNMTRLPPYPPPAAVRRLDLTHNALSDLTALLTRDDLTLWLQHNPLLCDCLQVNDLHRYRNQIGDFDNVTCSDGSLVSSLSPREHCGDEGGEGGVPSAVAAGVVVLVVLTAGGGALLAWRQLRPHVKAVLRKRRYKLQPEPHYMYDGFLAFSYHDSEQADRVIECLEGTSGPGGGPAGLRLCVHHRDWMPGEWVPAAVTRSVESSRRTVALVSRHFAASVWARAELRHAAARTAAGRGPGPVLVLLGPVPKDMRPHVRRHHALRWEDPRLWDKLRRLLAPSNALQPPATSPTDTPCPTRDC